jgi:hypothetical protein
VHREKPQLRIERFGATHPGEDDSLWSFSEGSAVEVAQRQAIEVQIETHPGGRPPFLIESTGHDERVTTSDVGEAIKVILEWLAKP